MYGYIYITTNLINGMKYIGKHKASRFDLTYKGSGKVLLRAFKKYGRENFSCQILEKQAGINTICESLAELNEAEKFYIAYYNCVYDSAYYNLKPGGDGGCLEQSDQTKEKLSHWNKDRTFINNGEICIKVLKSDLENYLAQGWRLGQLAFNHTDSFKQKVSETLTGYRCMHKGDIKTRVPAAEIETFIKDGYELGWPKSKTKPKRQSIKYMMKDDVYVQVKESEWETYLANGWVFKCRPRKTGYKLSDSHVEKLKKAHTGEKHSPERIARHAAKLAGRKYMHKDGQVKLVPAGEEETFLAAGWLLGKK